MRWFFLATMLICGVCGFAIAGVTAEPPQKAPVWAIAQSQIATPNTAKISHPIVIRHFDRVLTLSKDEQITQHIHNTQIIVLGLVKSIKTTQGNPIINKAGEFFPSTSQLIITVKDRIKGSAAPNEMPVLALDICHVKDTPCGVAANLHAGDEAVFSLLWLGRGRWRLAHPDGYQRLANNRLERWNLTVDEVRSRSKIKTGMVKHP